MIPQKPFPVICLCHSLVQNSVSLIRISRFWKHLPTKTVLSHHLSVKPSRAAFRVEQRKHQKVTISKSCWQENLPLMQVRVGTAEYSRHCCLTIFRWGNWGFRGTETFDYMPDITLSGGAMYSKTPSLLNYLKKSLECSSIYKVYTVSYMVTSFIRLMSPTSALSAMLHWKLPWLRGTQAVCAVGGPSWGRIEDPAAEPPSLIKGNTSASGLMTEKQQIIQGLQDFMSVTHYSTDTHPSVRTSYRSLTTIPDTHP